MNPLRRLAAALGLFAVIYFPGLFAIPSLEWVRSLVRRHPFLEVPVFIQLFFLGASLLCMVLLGRGKADRAVFGFRGVRPRRLIAPAAAAAAAAVLSFAVMAGVMGAAGDGGGGPRRGGAFLHTVLFLWLLAGTCEEVFYRGLLQGFMDPLKRFGFRVFAIRVSLPVAVSALLFGLGHLCLLCAAGPAFVTVIVFSATLTGLVCGYFREKTGSLLPAVAAHVTANVVGYTLPAWLSLVT